MVVRDESEIWRTIRLARSYAFNSIQTNRSQNASYPDSCICEMQSFMSLVQRGTTQGAHRFARFSNREQTHHGDTHLRAVKQFTPKSLLEEFDSATGRVLSVIESEASFRRSVTVAIDITTIPYYGRTAEMPMVSGPKDSGAEHSSS